MKKQVILLLAILLLLLVACNSENKITDEDVGAQDFAPVDDDEIVDETTDNTVDNDEIVDEIIDEDVETQDFATVDDDEIADQTTDEIVDEIADETVDDDTPATYPPDHPNELITDRHFTRGFRAINADGDNTGYMNPLFAEGDTVWHLGQWGSYSDLSDATPTTLTSGSEQWKDGNGHAIIGAAGTNESDLSLFVDGLQQYGGVYYDHENTTDARTTWVHLLTEQLIGAPGAAGPGCLPLSQISSLDFSVDAKLLFDDTNKTGGYDKNRHAALYLIYFTIQNLNTASDGYGDFLWFGLRLYDDREAYPGLTVSGDDFSGKLIYNIGIDPVSPVGLGDNQWHPLKGDLLPHIKLALKEAWSRNYIPKSRVLSDYRIGAMNIGWECSGLNNTEFQIKDLSLIYTEQDFPELRYDFNTDGNKERWTTSNMTDTNSGPVGGNWSFTVSGSDPIMMSPTIAIDAASYKSISIRMANNNASDSSPLQLFWKRFGDETWNEAKSAAVAIDYDGSWNTYTIDLAALPERWKGQITQLRIDPIIKGDGSILSIDSIVLTPK